MAPNCPTCHHVYMGADERLRCRINGLQAKPANAEGCRHFEREAGSDDEPMTWFKGAWVCDAQGRGD